MNDEKAEMKLDPVRVKALVSNVQLIAEKIARAAQGRNVCHYDFLSIITARSQEPLNDMKEE
jgi:hypothetical protein